MFFERANKRKVRYWSQSSTFPERERVAGTTAEAPATTAEAAGTAAAEAADTAAEAPCMHARAASAPCGMHTCSSEHALRQRVSLEAAAPSAV